ncbi:sensor histidine kinase [Emticicia sp. SJ17W-69]|uniref:sensor histidine kinase n=1 Tax=Emticicia sp. SJ17W-69 TaxID=3421657 RepID=UPI003EB9B92C
MLLHKTHFQNPRTKVIQKAQALKNIIIYYFDNQIQSDSLNKYCDLYIQFTIQNKLNESILDAYYRKVNALRYQVKWIELIKTGKSSLETIKKLKIPASAYQLSLITDEMVYGYIFLTDLENVNFYTNQSIAALKKENKNGLYNAQLSQLFLTKARAYGYSQMFEIGNIFLDSSLVYINKTSEKVKKHYLFNDIVSNKIELNRGNEALPMALECLHFFEKIPSDRGLAEIQMLLGRIYLAQKEYNKSIEFSKKPIGKITNPRILYHCYESQYRSYKAKGLMTEALVAFEKYHEFLSQLFNAKVANEKSALEKRFIEDKSTVLLNIQKQEVATQKTYRNYFILGAVLLSIVSIGLFFNRRLLKKQKQEIENQKLTIEELNVSLEEKVKIRTAELQQAFNEIKEAMQRGQTLERKRMAADLHDNLGSLLSAVSISMEAINPTHLSENEKKVYENVSEMIENAYFEIRLLSHNLLPEALEKGNLGDAFATLVDKLNTQNRTYFSLKINHLKKYNKKIELNLYSIALEICNNILKHAEADEAKVNLFEKNESIILEISDNGKGFENKEKGFGLKNVEARLQEISGKIQIKSMKNKGTKVICSVPLN